MNATLSINSQEVPPKLRAQLICWTVQASGSSTNHERSGDRLTLGGGGAGGGRSLSIKIDGESTPQDIEQYTKYEENLQLLAARRRAVCNAAADAAASAMATDALEANEPVLVDQMEQRDVEAMVDNAFKQADEKDAKEDFAKYVAVNQIMGLIKMSQLDKHQEKEQEQEKEKEQEKEQEQEQEHHHSIHSCSLLLLL